MRFLLSALAAVALVSFVSAQDYSTEELLNESEFDVSAGAVRSESVGRQEFKQATPQKQKQKIQAPVQQRYEVPVQEKIELPVRQTKYEAPVQRENIKEKTFMLQPILLMPKQSKAKKMLKFDVDRAMAYRVSPKVSSENSRSVDISFSPILNAKIRNILLTGEEEQHSPRDLLIETAPLLSSSKYQTKQVKAAPAQFRAPIQSQWAGSQWSGLQGISEIENPSSSYVNRFSGVEGLETPTSYTEQFEFLNEQPISPRSYQFTQDVFGTRFQNPYMNSLMNEDVSPVTEKNIIALGIEQPVKLNQMLKTCIARNVNTNICKKVIDSAKLLVHHPVASTVFEGIQI